MLTPIEIRGLSMGASPPKMEILVSVEREGKDGERGEGGFVEHWRAI